MNWGRRLYRGALSVYLALAIAWCATWKIVGDRNGALYLLNSLACWLLGGAWLASWLRFARSAPWLAVALSEIFGWIWLRHYHWMFWRRLPDPEGRAPAIRVLSANLLRKNRDFTALARVLRQQPVDVAAFQEVNRTSVTQIFAPLRDAYPFQYWISNTKSDMGLGVMARRPITLERRWALNLGGTYGLRFRLHLEDRTLLLYNMHLLSPLYNLKAADIDRLLTYRNHQMARILEDAQAQREPVLLIGDWNTTEGSDIYRTARNLFQDCWAEAGRGPGWTWPHNLEPHGPWRFWPCLRLDHAFCSRELEVTEARVLSQPMGSDHSPLLLTLRLPATQG